jgi:ubiquinone/menaquinone biosynthesis C-methylase UbiE
MSNQPATQVLVQIVQIERGMKVLAVAGGFGEIALELAKAIEPGGHVTATDTSSVSLEASAERARRLGLSNLTFREASPHALPFPDGAFDRVTCRFDSETFVEFQRALRECYRVLKPGGKAVFASYQLPAKANLTLIEPSAFAAAMRRAGFSEILEANDESVTGTRPNRTCAWLETRNEIP